MLLEKAHACATAGGRGILLDKLFAAAGIAEVVDDVAVHGPTLRFGLDAEMSKGGVPHNDPHILEGMAIAYVDMPMMYIAYIN